jgi:hypothetical protein
MQSDRLVAQLTTQAARTTNSHWGNAVLSFLRLPEASRSFARLFGGLSEVSGDDYLDDPGHAEPALAIWYDTQTADATYQSKSSGTLNFA